MKKKLLELDELGFDKTIYPRNGVNWFNVMNYANAMKTGSNFPPITVTMVNFRWTVIDGWHRCNAAKQNKQKYIEAEIIKCKTLEEAYIEAVKRNSEHGIQFNPQEKSKISIKLKEIGLNTVQIEELVKIPYDKLTKFTADRLANAMTGEEVVLNSSLKHMAGNVVNDELLNNKHITAHDQDHLLDSVLYMLRNNAFDLSDPNVISKLRSIYYKTASLLIRNKAI